MKIALVLPGGVDRSGTHRVIPCLLALIERVARRHELHVFALRQEPNPCVYELLGATVHNIGARPRRARAFAAIAAEHRRTPFDVLHAVWAAPPGVVAAAAGRVLRRPVLLHLTGGDLSDLPEIGYGLRVYRRGRAWLRLAVAGASRVTVPSLAMQEAAALLGIHAERLTYGVALDSWPPREPAPTRTSPARLLHVGSLNEVKDQTMLLRAADRLRRDGLAFRLDIVGGDTLGGRVQRLARELGLGDHIVFHDFLPQPEVRGFFERADLLLVSSRHEADPIVALEAAIAGVPVVGTAVGHLREWAPDAAATVAVGDDAALASEVARLLPDLERRRRMAYAAQTLALRHDADRTADRVLAAYHDLAAGRRAGAAM